MRKSISKMLALTTSVLVMSTSAYAQSSDNEAVVLERYRIDSNHCMECGPVKLESVTDLENYLDNASQVIKDRLAKKASNSTSSPGFSGFSGSFFLTL